MAATDAPARDEDQEIAHRIDAPAPGIGRVARDHHVVDRHLPVEADHRDRQRDHQHRPGHEQRPGDAGEQQRGHDREQDMRRDPFHEPPDRELREPAGDEDRGRDPADRDQREILAMRSSTIFGSATVTMLKASPAPSAITMNNPKIDDGERFADAHLRRRLALARHDAGRPARSRDRRCRSQDTRCAGTAKAARQLK